MTKKRKNPQPGGRPTVMTEAVIRKLEEAFSNGATDLQACFYAGISKTALYEYQDRTPYFAERKEGLKSHLQLIAKNVLAKSIKAGDQNDARWLLERKEKLTYSTRVENTGADGGAIAVKSIDINLIPAPQTLLTDGSVIDQKPGKVEIVDGDE